MSKPIKNEPLTKEEEIVCEIIWGVIPKDVKWIRGSQKFKNAIKDYENSKLKENKQQ